MFYLVHLNCHQCKIILLLYHLEFISFYNSNFLKNSRSRRNDFNMKSGNLNLGTALPWLCAFCKNPSPWKPYISCKGRTKDNLPYLTGLLTGLGENTIKVLCKQYTILLKTYWSPIMPLPVINEDPPISQILPVYQPAAHACSMSCRYSQPRT